MIKKIIIILLLLVAVVIVIVFFLLFPSKKQGAGSFPTPTPFNQTPEGAGSGASVDKNPTAVEKDRESGLVVQMAQGLPYYGKNFSLYYDFNTNSFTLHINPTAIDSGNAEFAAFLKKNKIDNPSWVNNLTTLYTIP
jgi:hypothetical protein